MQSVRTLISKGQKLLLQPWRSRTEDFSLIADGKLRSDIKIAFRKLQEQPNLIADPLFANSYPLNTPSGSEVFDLTINYETHPAYKTLTQSNPELQSKALEKLTPFFLDVFRRYFLHEVVMKRTSYSALSSKTKELWKNGTYSFSVSKDEKEKLRIFFAKTIEEVRERRRGKAPKDRGVTPSSKIIYDVRRENFLGAEVLLPLLEKKGVLKMCSESLGREVRLTQAALMIKDSTDTNLYEVYDNPELKDPRSIYIHQDSDFGTIKVGLYLSDVTAANGPFCYVEGSHRSNMTIFERLTRVANDTSGLDHTDLEARRAFMSLPPHLRKKANFGNDLIDNSPASKQVLKKEKQFLSKEGDMFIFDNRGFHRGGLVKEGERIVIFMLVTAVSTKQ